MVRIDNDPAALAAEVAKAGAEPGGRDRSDLRLVLGRRSSWRPHGANVHLAHPSGIDRVRGSAGQERSTRRQRSRRPAAARVGCPRRGSPRRQVRELRELVRYRAKLVALRSGLKAQVHAVIAKHGVPVPMTDLFGVGRPPAARRPATCADAVRGTAIESLRRADRASSTAEIDDARADRSPTCFDDHAGYRAIQAISRVSARSSPRSSSPRSATCTRSPSPRHLRSWSGLTPRHRESDTTVRRGPITKQGSKLVRWAAIEAAARQRGGTHLQHTYRQLD